MAKKSSRLTSADLDHDAQLVDRAHRMLIDWAVKVRNMSSQSSRTVYAHKTINKYVNTINDKSWIITNGIIRSLQS